MSQLASRRFRPAVLGEPPQVDRSSTTPVFIFQSIRAVKI